MKQAQSTRTIMLGLLVLFTLAMTFAVYAGTDPSQPDSISYLEGRTVNYSLGTNVNLTRSFIHVISLTETGPTVGWTGVVGNVSASFGLVDGLGFALYNWNVYTTTGEIYATHEANMGEGTWHDGGIPNWATVECANSTMRRLESWLFNHSSTLNYTTEDAYTNTFTTTYGMNETLFVGDTLVTDAADGGETCSVIYLNTAGAAQAGDWLEVVLTDQTGENEAGAGAWDLGPLCSATGQDCGGASDLQYDLMYGVMMQNDTVGYSGETFDFQLLLPQDKSTGNASIVPFYFYVELQ